MTMDIEIKEIRGIPDPQFVGEALEFLEPYFYESMFEDCDMYDIEMSIAYIDNSIRRDDKHFLKVTRGDELIGICMFGLGWSFWNRPMLALETLYVKPEYRGIGLGRQLLKAAKRLAEIHNYMLVESVSTSGFEGKDTEMFTNSMIKEGFRPVGRTCIWINPNKGDK